MRILIIVVIFIQLITVAITTETNLTKFSAVSCVIGSNKFANVDSVKYEPVEKYVFFYLYTKEDPNGREIVHKEESLQISKFNLNRTTKIITHGYKRTRKSSSVVRIRNALLKSGDYNVIVVDWSKTHLIGVIPKFYTVACEWVPKVGAYVAELLNFLVKLGTNTKNVTLIGHSLGAHVMGMAGYKTTSKVNVIIGLDPAGPNYEFKKIGERLSIEDADTVITIHTNAGDCGMSQPLGHYDFYANGGTKQPGCKTNSCAHARAYEIYAEAINSDKGFFGNLCSDPTNVKKDNCTGDMAMIHENLRTKKAKEGTYYFETNESPPYAVEKK